MIYVLCYIIICRLALCNWASILFQRNDESWEKCTSTCRYMLQSIASWLVGFFVLSEHLSQSTSAPPIQDGADKFLVCSSSKKILRQKLHDTQLGGIEHGARRTTLVKSQFLSQAKILKMQLMLALFLQILWMVLQISFEKNMWPWGEYSSSTSLNKTKLLMFVTVV